ncbi:MAG: hypothetical protein LLF76_07820 [Planctomycetaceae bacterium]|nr:hypothetical protein [Planctomycetaceae bacterium]
MLNFFVTTYIKMFFLLAPFFSMSLFLKMSEEFDSQRRHRAAMRASGAILVAITIFFFFGKPLFSLVVPEKVILRIQIAGPTR